jgi:hypothetical protein
MRTTLFVLVALLYSVPALALDFGDSTELYLPNQSGGDMVLTKEACNFPQAIKIGFNNRSYATDDNGGVYEGCWLAPEIDPVAFEDLPPGMTIIPLVNLWYNNTVTPFKQDQFTPFKHGYIKEGTL